MSPCTRGVWHEIVAADSEHAQHSCESQPSALLLAVVRHSGRGTDFVDLLAAFADASVRYLVVGGYAVGFHDRPRATKDLDLLLAGDPDNVERACRALDAFGATPATVQALRQSANDEVVWFGVPPVRVDLLKSVPGIEFDAAFARRVPMEAGELALPVVGLDDLISMKRAADRDQDRADVRRLERRQKMSR